MQEAATQTLYCSFCAKSQHEVRKLIAGPTVFICNECVDLCNEIVRENPHGPRQMHAGDIGCRSLLVVEA